ncbi:uncharacterized protein LOC143189988 isoform X2 [Rhynchophorus ferrugineus]|uniref:uncharacterized protein LOC143189988 isoform X2 n=2 Tax=Rhynchophorus ferrugineus TaxID=354439 RepID=UPI003FCEBB62
MRLISIILFIYCDIVNLTPTIISSNLGYCNFTKNSSSLTTKSQFIHMFSNIWTIDGRELKIYYKFCGNLSLNTFHTVSEQGRMDGSLAYLLNDGKIKNLGTSFELINDTSFHSLNGEICTIKQNYSLLINLICPKNRNENDNPMLYFVSEDKCKYYVNMRNPNCLPNYSLVINGHYLNIPIDKSFTVYDKDRNFSIALGNSVSLCGENDILACEFTRNTKTNLLLASTLHLHYIAETNELLFTGNTFKKGSAKFDKRFCLTLKCNWENDVYALKYIPKQTQGKKYDFELETSFGCVKYPRECKVYDSYYIYDLSKLYKENLWKVKDSDSNVYVMQICGPLNQKMEENCKSTFAQICEINNNNKSIINRGSIMRPLKVENDIVTLEMESGARCAEDPGKLYSSTIRFACNDKELGPKFVQKDGCHTYFNWKTPHACPQINVSACRYIKPNYHKCTFNYQNGYYDLTALSVKDTKIVDGNNEIIIRPCGGIDDPGALCKKDLSIAMKNMNESNIKYRLLSLGKFYESTLIGNDLVIKYYTGSSCGNGDYTSEIRFKCSNVEKSPVVTKIHKCHYQILWETFYGCPREQKCSLIDKALNRSVDFTNATKAIEFSLGNSSYKFNICQSNFTVCQLKDAAAVLCRYQPFSEMDFKIYSHSSFLNWKLPNTNNAVNTVGQIVIHFKCNDSEELDSKQMMNKSMLRIEYSTKYVCSSECSRHVRELENEYCHVPIDEPSSVYRSSSPWIIGLSIFLGLLIVAIILSILIYWRKRKNLTCSDYMYFKDLQK